MIPTTISIEEKYTYFKSDHYKIIENNEIEGGTLLNSTNDSLEPFDYRVGKYGEGAFKAMECNQNHTCYPYKENPAEEDIWRAQRYLVAWVGEEEALFEPDFCNGSNDAVQIFNQKCVIWYKRDSVYDFRQSGHQCIIEICYQIEGDIDMLKCVVCIQG